ncbi:MAG: hypothetical protein KF830_12650 [Planctomycetes bacterium]|nr:hypothetical protein [Planctomycetota bacterium]
MVSPNLSIRAGLAALILASVAAAQNQTTLKDTAPGDKNTVTFDLNHQPTSIVSVTIDGNPADVTTQSIDGTKVKVKFAQPPAKGASIKVIVQYSGSEPRVQSTTWTNT